MSPRAMLRIPARAASAPGPATGTGSRPSGSARGLAALAAFALLLAGCSIGSPAFDPTGACTSDGRAVGAYPDLEALVPAHLAGKAPQRLDSGRNCTSAGLGTLADHGITELRFAGGIWPTAAESGTSLAVFRAPGLTAAWLGEYYESGARASSKVSALETARPPVQGRPGYRLDVENDGRLQTIVVWPSADASVMRVAIVSGAARDGATKASQATAVQAAIAAFAP